MAVTLLVLFAVFLQVGGRRGWGGGGARCVRGGEPGMGARCVRGESQV